MDLSNPRGASHKSAVPFTALGVLLLTTRTKKDLSMHVVAAHSGVSAAQISRIENGGQPSIKLDEFIALANVFGVSPLVFLRVYLELKVTYNE